MNGNKKLHYAWVILIVLCIVRSLSAAGINNVGGLFLRPVSEELGVGIGNLSLYFSISSVATLLFLPVAGKLMNQKSIRIIGAVAVILQCGSFIAFGLMKSVWGFYLLSIPMGIGGAILVNLMGPILVNRWFEKYEGISLGILMASAGIFGAVFQPLFSHFIADKGWRYTYIVPGVVILVVSVVLLLVFIKNSPADKGVRPLGAGKKYVDKTDVTIVDLEEKSGIPYKAARKSGTFYLLIIFMVAITAFGAFSQHMAAYGADIGYSAGKVGSALSVSMIGSTVGAILIGIIGDKIGAYKATLMVMGIALLSVICLTLGHINYWMFVAGGFLLGLGSMGIPVLSPLLTREFFGDRDYELIYSNIMMGAPLASILLLPAYGFIYDMLGGYNLVFVILVVLTLVGTGSIIAAQRQNGGRNKSRKI